MTDLRIKLYLDTAALTDIERYAADPLISGFTTNPTLMRRAGVTDYAAFACDVLRLVGDKPVSFEVLSDDFGEMERQARIIAAWGDNVYVKIPITNMAGDTSTDLIRRLSHGGVKVNVTAILQTDQIIKTMAAVIRGAPSIISVFAGRISDVGCDPAQTIKTPLAFIRNGIPTTELLWASTREVYNIYQADNIGADIITVTPDILAKYVKFKDYDLARLSLDTVQQFVEDAKVAGYQLKETIKE